MAEFNQSRQTTIRIIIAIVFAIILVRLMTLQLFTSKYSKLANDQAILRKIVYPSRGIIFDRKGKAILDNTTMYDLMVTPSQLKGVDTIILCRILGIDTAEFKERVVTAIIKNSRNRPSVFEPLLSPEKYARINENLFRFQPAFFLQERPIRTYPYRAAAHILGYVGEVDSPMLKRSNFFYQMGDFAGRSGLESYYEKILMGKRGIQYILRDNFNRPIGKYENGEFDTISVAGRHLNTYIDVEVQQLAEKLMNDKVGSVVAIEPKTGGIIAMTSGPTYDPNELTGSESRKNFSRLFLDPASPLLNRGMQGVYPPGSTFKPLGALVALDEGLITPEFGYSCFGRYGPCGRPACTHTNAGHAANLSLSIANSCNSYYAHVLRMALDNKKYGNIEGGLMKWKEYMSGFGLGHRLGIDLPGEYAGYIPDTARYNKVFRKGGWSSCTIASLGIGQGEIQATPMQMANAMCLIANRGWYYTPHFVKNIDGETAEDTLLNKYRQKISPLHIPNDYYQAVIDGMEMVVTNGTARNAAIEGYSVCAKTGTVENYFRGKKQQNHSFFVAFAPKDNPQIAICVVVENAGFGSTWAAPIASLLMEKFLTDSIAGDKRKAEIERISNVVITPAKIRYELFRRDSIKQLRDSAQRVKERRMRIDSTAIGQLKHLPTMPNKQPAKDQEQQHRLMAIIPTHKLQSLKEAKQRNS
ncbi:penicillin-binding protein 2 [Lacibacter sediminis]|uniref:Penicillin-binding protein 2 n=1 Tax=Lacibacter sediminis TaxID=2760713 RepID=A0A7G5XHZ3_9BACT|nr:penicillin-binding protein 2 [Lacibacter sediminis]QNA45096.1 penicillin-binding protein 2 [Lacibacter sediminis]